VINFVIQRFLYFWSFRKYSSLFSSHSGSLDRYHRVALLAFLLLFEIGFFLRSRASATWHTTY
jgi:hypothetical protein